MNISRAESIKDKLTVILLQKGMPIFFVTNKDFRARELVAIL